MSDYAAALLRDYPRPWRIEITEIGGLALDRDGNTVSMFDAEDDAEFWRGLVDVVNSYGESISP